MQENIAQREAEAKQWFIAWESSLRNNSRKGSSNSDVIMARLCFVDLTGDLIAGLLLAKIVYYHLPSKKSRASDKLKVEKKGRRWIAKAREDWWPELRIAPSQVDRATKKLTEQRIIDIDHCLFGKRRIVHYALNWDVFVEKLREVLQPEYVNPKQPKLRREVEAERAARNAKANETVAKQTSASESPIKPVAEKGTAIIDDSAVTERGTAVSPKEQRQACHPKGDASTLTTQENTSIEAKPAASDECIDPDEAAYRSFRSAEEESDWDDAYADADENYESSSDSITGTGNDEYDPFEDDDPFDDGDSDSTPELKPEADTTSSFPCTRINHLKPAAPPEPRRTFTQQERAIIEQRANEKFKEWSTAFLGCLAELKTENPTSEEIELEETAWAKHPQPNFEDLRADAEAWYLEREAETYCLEHR